MAAHSPVRYLREAVKTSFVLTATYYLLDDLRYRLRLARGNIETHSGMAHGHRDLEKSLTYIEDVFRDYRLHAGVDQFRGRVAEVGPGDSCGVALLFLADGCDSVDLADRFYSRRDSDHQAQVYQALIDRHAVVAQRLSKANLHDETTFDGVTRHLGATAAAERFFDTHRRYDCIVSRAVLEHVYDPLLALECMAQALNPGGLLLHKVDLRDHGMFSTAHHELKYLEVPDILYPLMTGASGRPNRILIDRYRRKLETLDLDFRLPVTRLAGVGDITPHLRYEDISVETRERSLAFVRSVRRQFARSLREVADEDLSIAGFFLVARKRSPQAG